MAALVSSCAGALSVLLALATSTRGGALPERVRVEHFALVSARHEVEGVARLLRRERPTGVQYELELDAWTVAARLRLVETHELADDGSPRHELVWREHLGSTDRPGGRCVVARWSDACATRASGELESLQWGALEPVRGVAEFDTRPSFPLEGWEAERLGRPRGLARYEPLSDRVERTQRGACELAGLRCSFESPEGEAPAARRIFAGPALLAFRLGPASAWAVAIPQTRWRELAEAHASAVAAPVTQGLPAQVSRDGYPGTLVGGTWTR